MRGEKTASCRAYPKASRLSTCCSSWSPSHAACAATASTFRACATWPRLWRPMSVRPSRSATIRYDPRDVSEIRVFHREHFLCRAVNEEHAGEALTLKDIE